MTFDLATITTAIAADSKRSCSRPVVATPTGGGRSFTKFQERAPVEKSSSLRVATSERDRPKSPARIGSRSRDIVQEVYDRMGVNYKRGQSSFELDDSKSTISIHSGTKSVTKSPSRNRTNARHMYNNEQSVVSPPPADSDARSVRSNISSGIGRRWSSSRSVTSTTGKTSNRPVVVYPSKKDTAPRYNTQTLSEHQEGNFPAGVQKKPSLELDSRDDVVEDCEANVICGREDVHEDGEERREGPPAEVVEGDGGRTSPLSVKSRISAFSGYNGARSSFNSSRHNSQTSWSVDVSGNVAKPVAFRKGAKSSLANSYMAAINSNKQNNPPVTKPPATCHKAQPSDFSITSIPVENLPSGAYTDDHSVAASEISAEDFTTAASKKGSSRIVSGRTKNPNPSIMTKTMVNQMIEEKIQAKLAELQNTIEDQLRRVEEQANNRIHEIEKKMDTLMSLPDKQKILNSLSPVVQPSYLRPVGR